MQQNIQIKDDGQLMEKNKELDLIRDFIWYLVLLLGILFDLNFIIKDFTRFDLDVGLKLHVWCI